MPIIVFAEIGYLAGKKRIDTNLEETKSYLRQYREIKQQILMLPTVLEVFIIDDIPELHDRLIAASAKELNIPILTNDPEIQSSKHVEAIWN